MKSIVWLFLIVIPFISLEIYGQDTAHIPQKELNNFFLSLDTLEQQDSLKSILIIDLELQLKNYKMLSQQDSLLLFYSQSQTQTA